MRCPFPWTIDGLQCCISRKCRHKRARARISNVNARAERIKTVDQLMILLSTNTHALARARSPHSMLCLHNYVPPPAGSYDPPTHTHSTGPVRSRANRSVRSNQLCARACVTISTSYPTQANSKLCAEQVHTRLLSPQHRASNTTRKFSSFRYSVHIY